MSIFSIDCSSARLAAVIVLAVTLSIASQQVKAQESGQTGKEVVERVCVTCHGPGTDGAPRIGDRKAWANRTAHGLTNLSRSALNGIRKMPSHGGSSTVTDAEIKSAIVYMVNASGGHWTEPISKAAAADGRSGEQIVRAHCIACHGTGVDGAPKIGDRAMWIPRAKQGFELLIRSAINGHGGMAPRGGVASLTDVEIRAAITYMLNPVTAAKAQSAGAEPAVRPDPNRRIIDGVEIYFGVISAETLRLQHSGTDAESTMHGGIPRGSGYYHVNVSLFDDNAKVAITDAHVEAKVADPVMGNQVKTLEPMVLNNSASYGNYFRLTGKDAFTIAVLIRKPGATSAIETQFTYRR